jgi:hypothetical protein
LAEPYGEEMSAEIGGNATSAVPVGVVAMSAVAGADPEGRTPLGSVVWTAAGLSITPMVGGVLEFGERSSLAREKPQATSPAAAATPTVEAMRTTRDRRFDSIVSTTATTLSRWIAP